MAQLQRPGRNALPKKARMRQGSPQEQAVIDTV
jgi:hypothetical protein